jgi:acyl homoserine lactone synthase
MILVVEKYNSHLYPALIEEMFRLRARIFRDKMGWEVKVENGLERDRYDDEDPVYILYVDDKTEKLVGSLRLLPMTGPTLLADFFSDTLPDAVHLSAPSIWECTRFCVDEELLAEGSREQLVFASGVLFAALGEVGLKSGIQTVLGNFDAPMLRLYRRVGCDVEVLGHTRRYGRRVYLGSFAVTPVVVDRIKARLRNGTEARGGAQREMAA